MKMHYISRQKMMTNIITKFGHESNPAINFAMLAQEKQFSYMQILTLYEKMMGF